MKYIPFFLLMVFVSLAAAPYSVGQSVAPLELSDQFGSRVNLNVMPNTVILVFDKGTSTTVNEYLIVQDKGYLDKNKALFIADISQMPRFIAESFALPKMRTYGHTVLLIQDEEQGLRFPYQEDKITVMKFQGNMLSKVKFISTPAELRKAIEE